MPTTLTNLINPQSGRLVPLAAGHSSVLRSMLAEISRLARAAAPEAIVSGRRKSFRSAQDKAARLRVDASLVLDLIGVRVVVSSVEQCYRVLQEIHFRFPHMEPAYDDYIRKPKPNGYRSIHTVVFDGGGHPVEIQLRTHDMHKCAERGSASHRLYKQTQEPAPSSQPHRRGNQVRIPDLPPPRSNWVEICGAPLSVAHEGDPTMLPHDDNDCLRQVLAQSVRAGRS